ncbi:MAG: NUDIX domain-containing protein [Planctomycetes bacterium]|nr:NUDIX domain-containing protein [Planctomycetota bacterium]
MPSAFFRASVGCVVTDGAGRVLMLRRRGRGAGSWQFPQGGIEEGEEPRAALVRELAEEAGLGSAALEIVSEHPRWIAYELPRELRNAKVGLGQVQRWFVARLRAGITPCPDGIEFDAFEWVAPAEALARAVEFRRAGYAEVLAAAALA